MFYCMDKYAMVVFNFGNISLSHILCFYGCAVQMLHAKASQLVCLW